MQTQLIRYIRKSNKTPFGVAVAILENGKVSYGYSVRNKKDKWNRQTGLEVARKRASLESFTLPEVKSTNQAVLSTLEELERRALRYFKDLTPEQIKLNKEFKINNLV